MTRDAQAASAAGLQQKRLALVFGMTAVYLVAEVVGGLMSGSLALLADAGHMLTDVGGLGLALFAIRFAQRPATPARTYGYYRVEILAAMANAVMLIGVSLYILVEAYERLKQPPAVASGAMLAVAGVGLVVNVAGLLLLRRGSGESLNLQGAYFEVLSDLLTSIGVIAAGVIMWTTSWYYADPLISAAIGLWIFPRTWRLLRQAVGILLEGTPSDVNPAALREAIAALPWVADVHDLHVWSLTSGVNAMSVHVVHTSAAGFDDVLRRVRDAANGNFKIRHVTVQVERQSCGDRYAHI